MTEFFPLSAAEASALSQSAALAAPPETTGDQFLRLGLAPGTTVLLPLPQLTEVMTLPISQIMPMPHMPPWTMGVYNWRGDILWIVDLGHLCGLPPWYHYPASSSCSAVILNGTDPGNPAAKGKPLGLVVHRVEDIEWCTADLIQPLAGGVPTLPMLQPFLRGYRQQPEPVPVLDGHAILHTVWQYPHPDARFASA
ncbi:MAG: chemotaxis protein CheW [Synechococcales cyanobacterium C42_A2020_086]|jgi:positive phototaxis protein PixI|nr:chemotaxis protein CheW [Synechococcales cyanobacterium C42_A2020_086]